MRGRSGFESRCPYHADSGTLSLERIPEIPMRSRLNRSLSSVKSLAPYYTRLRVRSTSAYDFTCRCCGTVLEPEKAMFELIEALIRDSSPDDDTGRLTVRSFLEPPTP